MYCLAFPMPGPFEMMVFAGIALLLFGTRLPGTMKSLGQSITQFKKGMNEPSDDVTPEKLPPQEEPKNS